jgi:hypothetical protein
MLSAAEVRAAAQSRIRWELLANLFRKDLKVSRSSEAFRAIGSSEQGLVDVARAIERTEEERRAEPSPGWRPHAAGDRGRP